MEGGNDQPLAIKHQPYKGVEHLVYASSSNVYGGNKKVPFSTDDRVDNPVSLYAATKKSNASLRLRLRGSQAACSHAAW